MTDKIGIAIVTLLLSCFVWVPITLTFCHYQDTKKIRQEALLDASRRINKDMEKACHCWYTDSRCNAPATKIVVCSMPDFMRHIP